MQVLKNIRQEKANYEINEVVKDGYSYLVVPVVMLVEGVHNGSAGAVLHVSEEMRKAAKLFEGIPVTFGHPEIDGVFVSVNVAGIKEKYQVGNVYNVKFEDNKLRGEIYLNKSLLQNKFQRLLQALLNKEKIEVSVGVFTDDIDEEGFFNNERYEKIARNYKPDHLAILLDTEGACSWQDGCGIRANEANNKNSLNMDVYTLKYKGTETTKWEAPNLSDFNVSANSWEDLTREEKKYVASHYLVGDEDAESFDELYYPVVNPKTGKLNENALRAVISGRGRMAKLPDDVKLKAIQDAYRLLNKEFDADLEVPESLENNNINNNKTEEYKMNNCVESRINEIIANSNGFFNEADKSWLSALDDKIIESLAVRTYQKLETIEDFLKMLPDSLKNEVVKALEVYKTVKEKYINEIVTHSKNFTKDELEKLEFNILEKFANEIKKDVYDFSLQANSKNDSFNDLEVLLPLVN